MTEMLQYCIYLDPKDFPGRFVVRRMDVSGKQVVPEARPLGVLKTLDDARKLVPETHSFCMPRMHGDDEVILETWMTEDMGKFLAHFGVKPSYALKNK